MCPPRGYSTAPSRVRMRGTRVCARLCDGRARSRACGCLAVREAGGRTREGAALRARHAYIHAHAHCVCVICHAPCLAVLVCPMPPLPDVSGHASIPRCAERCCLRASLHCERTDIHEAAGAARVRFGARADPATTLLNAANANPGRARRLVLGAVVVDLERSS